MYSTLYINVKNLDGNHLNTSNTHINVTELLFMQIGAIGKSQPTGHIP